MLQNREVSTVLDDVQLQDLIDLPLGVEDDLAAVLGSGLVRTAVKQAVAVGEEVALLAVTTEVEAAKLLVLGLLVVVGEVVGLRVGDVDAGRALSAGGHDHGATALGVFLVLVRDHHLVIAAGHHLRGRVRASSGRSRVEDVGLGVWACWN
jgi:hypothetical protein